MSRVLLVYDDSLRVPAEVSSLTGVGSFGSMLRRRERLSSTVRALADAAELDGMLHLRSAESLEGFEENARLHQDERLYFLLPANLAPTAERDDAVLFLRKLRHLTEPVALWQGDRVTGACLVDADGLRAYVADAGAALDRRDDYLHGYARRLPPVDDALGLVDLTEVPSTLEFLSGSFSARHFNHVAHDRHHVVKHSPDRDKIRREYRFYGLLPEEMQPYFLQPFGYAEDERGASYRTRRLFVPDMAVQWVHGAFTEAQFDQVLDHLLHFIEQRPRRDVGREPAEREARELYVEKVEARVAALLEMPAGRRVDALLEAGGVAGGVRAIQAEYLDLYRRVAPRRGGHELSVSHGDLCFSNILYSPSTQTFQLIDPRGADSEEQIYSDPYYDVAKLSHSVLGGYDFVLADLYELVHADDLSLRVALEDPASAGLRARFGAALRDSGFDVDLVRTCEASLFLSMLPLHIDAPKRVAALALRAREILAEIRGGR